MGSEKLAGVARRLRELAAAQGACPTPDHELLARFVEQKSELDFESLVRRHGAMVLQVGQRLLNNRHDAEDVLQATFLTLARKAGSLRKPGSVASWLHGVAHRLAQQVRAARTRRTIHESLAAAPTASDPVTEITLREAQMVLDRELRKLSERFRTPLILCYLEGATQDEAARELHVSLATLKRRLERGRELLRARLAKHRLTLPASLSVVLLLDCASAPAVTSALVHSIAQGALLLATGKPLTAGLVSAAAATLSQRMMRSMWITKLKMTALGLVLAAAMTGSGIFVRQASADRPEENAPPPAAQDAQQPQRGGLEQTRPDQPDVSPQSVQGNQAVDATAVNQAVKGDNYFIYSVQTDLQKELAPRKAGLFVLLDTTAAMENSKVRFRELKLHELEKALLPHRKPETHVHVTLFFRQRHDAVGLEPESLLRYALIGFMHEKGFSKFSVFFSGNPKDPTWQENSATFTGKPRQPKGDEVATVNEYVKAYPVRTEFSRYLTSDSDCAVVILPSLDKEKGVIPQAIRDAIADAVAKLKLDQKVRIMFVMDHVFSDEKALLHKQFYKMAEELGFETSTVTSR